MNKEETLGEIQREWQQFPDVAGGFSREEQTAPGAVCHWNIRESLLHVTAWDEEHVKILSTYLSTGKEVDYGNDEAVDRLNQEQVDEKRELTLDQVWTHLRQTHEIFLEFIGGLGEDAFKPGSYTVETIAMESFDHYREHREDMERFKASGQWSYSHWGAGHAPSAGSGQSQAGSAPSRHEQIGAIAGSWMVRYTFLVSAISVGNVICKIF